MNKNIFEIVSSKNPILKLSRVSDYRKLPKECVKVLEPFYNNSSIAYQIVGTVLNSVLTEKKSSFLLSRDIIDKLLRIDTSYPSTPPCCRSTGVYKVVTALLLTVLRIEVPSNKNKPALLVVSNEYILSLIGGMDSDLLQSCKDYLNKSKQEARSYEQEASSDKQEGISKEEVGSSKEEVGSSNKEVVSSNKVSSKGKHAGEHAGIYAGENAGKRAPFVRRPIPGYTG